MSLCFDLFFCPVQVYIRFDWIEAVSKTLVLHAGTHKTASTYIQNRLWLNRKLLRSLGVKLLRQRKKKTGQNKPFADSLRARNFDEIDALLSGVSPGYHSLIVSAEQLTQALIRKDCLEGLLEVLDCHGYALRLVVFLRDQPEYINSLYVQEVRRFYHAKTISRFFEDCRKRRSLWFDYGDMFSGVMRNPAVECSFLPYGFHFGDPFERLMATQGWSPRGASRWLPGDAGKSNDQPGVKGVWLAQKACSEMDRQLINRKKIKNRSKYIRRFSEPRGWGKHRFFGFDRAQVASIRSLYRQSNDEFAKAVWGVRDWNEAFAGLRSYPQNVLREDKLSAEELFELDELVSQVVEDVKRGSPDAIPL